MKKPQLCNFAEELLSSFFALQCVCRVCACLTDITKMNEFNRWKRTLFLQLKFSKTAGELKFVRKYNEYIVTIFFFE